MSRNVKEIFARMWSIVIRARRLPPGKKPPDIVYAVDDVPPLLVIALSGVQHVGLIAIFLIFPLLVVKELGASYRHWL